MVFPYRASMYYNLSLGPGFEPGCKFLYARLGALSCSHHAAPDCHADLRFGFLSGFFSAGNKLIQNFSKYSWCFR